MHRLRRAVAAVAALGLLTLPACSLLPGGAGSYELTAYFPRAVALYESAQVKVLGLPAGTVTDVEVEGNQVRVTMAIDDNIPVPKDVVAQLVPQSLIGERYVQLHPAWTQGDPRAEDGYEITMDHTIVPVEPDEALAALKEFLDTLDPDGLGRLIENAADSLDGNGAKLNSALGNLSQLVNTFAEKDDTLVRIVDNFDRFTQTLVTREAQLGQVLDAFAAATQVLADERAGLEALLDALAQLSATRWGSSPSTPAGCAPTSRRSPGSCGRSTPTSTRSSSCSTRDRCSSAAWSRRTTRRCGR